MDDWKDLFEGRTFITDLGKSRQVKDGEEVVEMGRYAVWAPQGEGHQIVEIGGDLEYLRGKYSVPTDRVCAVVRG